MITENKYFDKHRERLMINFFLRVKTWISVAIGVVTVGLAVGTFFVKPANYFVPHVAMGSAVLVLLIVFALSLLGAFSKVLTDEDVLKIVEEDEAFAEIDTEGALAFRKEEMIARPIEITCPKLYPGRRTILFRYFKKQDKLVFSHVEHVGLYFGQSTLFIKQYKLNHITGVKGYQQHIEVDYRDITTITTKIEATPGAHKFEQVVMLLGLVNGSQLEFTLRSNPLNGKQPKNLKDNEVEIIKQIRETIRYNK